MPGTVGVSIDGFQSDFSSGLAKLRVGTSADSRNNIFKSSSINISLEF